MITGCTVVLRITVKNLMGVAAMSRRSLHTAFLQHLGRTPGQELHRVRIERAKALLAQRDQTIEMIGQNCGYSRSNSFCVAFKQGTGMSPTQYRDKFLA